MCRRRFLKKAGAAAAAVIRASWCIVVISVGGVGRFVPMATGFTRYISFLFYEVGGRRAV